MTLPAKKTLLITEIGALTVRTAAALDPYGGDIYLPSPRAFAGIWALWGVLGGLAELGGQWARFAANLSVLVFLTTLIVDFGQKGGTALGLLERAAGAQTAGSQELGAQPPPPVARLSPTQNIMGRRRQTPRPRFRGGPIERMGGQK